MTATNKDLSIDGFILYRSFYEAIKTLSNKNQLIAYDTIMRYAFNGEEPTDLRPRVSAIFTMAKPQIDANRKKRLKKIESAFQTMRRDNHSILDEETIEKIPLPRKESKTETSNNSCKNEEDEFKS
jgi:hypothetical protein